MESIKYTVKIDRIIPAKPEVIAKVNDEAENDYIFGTPTASNVRVFLITNKTFSWSTSNPLSSNTPRPKFEYKIEGTDDWIEFETMGSIPNLTLSYSGGLFDKTFINDVRFRVSDSAGNASEETEIYNIHIN